MLNQKLFSESFVLNLIILLIPVSFIAGNLVLNLNLFILLIYGLLVFRFDIFRQKLGYIDITLIIFFIYVLINGFYNNFYNSDFNIEIEKNKILLKSFLYFRFLLIFFLIKYLVIKKILNYELIFYSFGACTLFVSLDLMYQFVFGKDVFGFEGSGRRLSGPFGDEYIAGAYIQRFFIFLPLSLIIFSKIEKKILLNLTLVFIIFLSLIGALFAGNRIPLFFMVIILFMLFIYEKKLRKVLLLIYLVFFTSFAYLLITDKNEIKSHYNVFTLNTLQIVKYLGNRFTGNQIEIRNTYTKEFETGFLTWEQNKVFGGGIKSFFYNCNNIEKSAMDKYGGTNCNTHPHNFYLQISAELGLFGLFLVILIFFQVLLKSLKFLHSSNNFSLERKLLVPFFIIFVVEVFPIRTTGSFFTTGIATLLFIMIAFIVGLLNLKEKKQYDKE